jgi:hypothetical protein
MPGVEEEDREEAAAAEAGGAEAPNEPLRVGGAAGFLEKNESLAT